MTVIPEIPFGAIENGRVLLQRLADHYDFTCEAGALANCIEYHEAVRCFEVIAQFASESTSALPHISAPCAVDVDALANEIRRVNGSNNLGAGALAEALMPFLSCVVTKPFDVASALLDTQITENVIDFFVTHGMIDESEEYSLQDIMAALHDNYEPTKLVDVAAVRRQAFEEGFENGVEQSLNALDAYDDITRNEAEQGIRKLKPDYRALSAGPVQGCGND